MNNQQAYKRALSAVLRFMSVEECGLPIQQDMASWEVVRALEEALAYEFKQGPKPHWWDEGKDQTNEQ
jgi:hypothetical protein